MKKEYWFWIIAVMIILLSSSYIIYKLVEVSSKPKAETHILDQQISSQKQSTKEKTPMDDTKQTITGEPVVVVRDLKPPTKRSEPKPDVNKTIEDIITGKTDETPEELNMTYEEAVRKYVYNCHYMSEPQDRLSCIEAYYSNNDEDYVRQKEECEKLDADEKDGCLDEFYYRMAREKTDIFCEAIMDAGLKNECRGSII